MVKEPKAPLNLIKTKQDFISKENACTNEEQSLSSLAATMRLVATRPSATLRDQLAQSRIHTLRE